MGQQQLLLLVIGILVVAFAVLAGFVAFDKKMEQFSADSLVEHNLSIATDAVFWKSKRDPYAGGNASYVGLESDGMQKLFLGDSTETGRYKITSASQNALEVTAVSLRYPYIGARTFINGDSIDSTKISYTGDITF